MIDKLREKLGSEVLENESLANHCTFKIGGSARYFFVAKSSEEIMDATEVAMKLGLKVFVLSGGSNVLFSDDGFDGLVVKIQNTKYNILDTRIEAEAGVKLAEVVNAAMENRLSGLEWAAGIPGTVGGAVRGNAGAYGHAIGESVEKVEAIKVSSFPPKADQPRVDKFQVSNYGKEGCKFEYKESVFKKNKDIILKVILKLSPGDKNKIKEEMEKVLKARGEKIPTEPSAGSFFKNVEITGGVINSFQSRSKENIPDDFVKKGKIPSAWLIENCGLKGKKIGGAEVSEKHANIIVNAGNASAADVIALASLVKMKVRDEFGIQLQEEVEYVGF